MAKATAAPPTAKVAQKAPPAAEIVISALEATVVGAKDQAAKDLAMQIHAEAVKLCQASLQAFDLGDPALFHLPPGGQYEIDLTGLPVSLELPADPKIISPGFVAEQLSKTLKAILLDQLTGLRNNIAEIHKEDFAAPGSSAPVVLSTSDDMAKRYETYRKHMSGFGGAEGEIGILGIRGYLVAGGYGYVLAKNQPGQYNDTLVVLFRDKNGLYCKEYTGSVDPGIQKDQGRPKPEPFELGTNETAKAAAAREKTELAKLTKQAKKFAKAEKQLIAKQEAEQRAKEMAEQPQAQVGAETRQAPAGKAKAARSGKDGKKQVKQPGLPPVQVTPIDVAKALLSMAKMAAYQATKIDVDKGKLEADLKLLQGDVAKAVKEWNDSVDRLAARLGRLEGELASLNAQVAAAPGHGQPPAADDADLKRRRDQLNQSIEQFVNDFNGTFTAIKTQAEALSKRAGQIVPVVNANLGAVVQARYNVKAGNDTLDKFVADEQKRRAKEKAKAKGQPDEKTGGEDQAEDKDVQAARGELTKITEDLAAHQAFLAKIVQSLNALRDQINQEIDKPLDNLQALRSRAAELAYACKEGAIKAAQRRYDLAKARFDTAKDKYDKVPYHAAEQRWLDAKNQHAALFAAKAPKAQIAAARRARQAAEAALQKAEPEMWAARQELDGAQTAFDGASSLVRTAIATGETRAWAHLKEGRYEYLLDWHAGSGKVNWEAMKQGAKGKEGLGSRWANVETDIHGGKHRLQALRISGLGRAGLTSASGSSVLRDVSLSNAIEPTAGAETVPSTSQAINVHYGGEAASTSVGNWSEGCQIIRGIDEYNEFIGFVKQSRNRFNISYNLIGGQALLGSGEKQPTEGGPAKPGETTPGVAP